MTARPLARAVFAVVVAAASVLLLTSGPGRRAPAPHHAIHVRAGDVTLRAVRAGRGTTVVLLHGYGESLMSWRGLFDRLAAHADVIALDLPGFGLSEKPPSGYGTVPLANTVLAAATALGADSFVLVGHSLGGAVAAAASLQAPGRVSGLVLIDPAGVAAPPLLPDTATPGGDAARLTIAEYEAQRTRFAAVHDPAWLAEDPADSTYLPASDAAYRHSLIAVLQEFDFAFLTDERARRIRLPTLIVWGAYDAVFPVTHGRWLLDRLPASRLVILERAWHRPHVERPAETADTVVAFLRALGMGSSP